MHYETMNYMFWSIHTAFLSLYFDSCSTSVGAVDSMLRSIVSTSSARDGIGVLISLWLELPTLSPASPISTFLLWMWWWDPYCGDLQGSCEEVMMYSKQKAPSKFGSWTHRRDFLQALVKEPHRELVKEPHINGLIQYHTEEDLSVRPRQNMAECLSWCWF